MSNTFRIRQFDPDVYKTDHKHEGKEMIFNIYAELKKPPIRLTDVFGDAAMFTLNYRDENGDEYTEERLYKEEYGFFCEYNATSDELTLNTHPMNLGRCITPQVYEEFKAQHLEEIRTRANKILHLTLVCPLCQKEHDAFHAKTILVWGDEEEYICDNLCKEYEDELDVEYVYLVEKKQSV